MGKYKNIISELIVTCFFVGKIKYAPGTFGSLLAFPLNYLLLVFLIKTGFLLPIEGFSVSEREFITMLLLMLSVIVILSIIGVIASNIYMKKHGSHDPKEIVIDELVGQMLTSSLTLLSTAFVYNSNFPDNHSKLFIDSLCFFILPFAFFRLCDILKPWPIGWIDANVGGGIGVMLDDIAAALLASLLCYAVVFTFITKT